MHPALRRASRIALVWLAAWGGGAFGPDSLAADVDEPPPRDQFVIIPLRIHVLRSRDLEEVDCHLEDGDIRRIVGKVNGIWHRGGIHWGLESIAREPAARQERFRLARDLGGGRGFDRFRLLIPERPPGFDGLHVFYLHELPVNGVWMGDDFAIVKETAQLRPVEGGIDEPIPRVTAHELGHALGLSHRQDRTNLLASGTTGTTLNEEEVATARRHAVAIAGATTVPIARAAAARAVADGDRPLARRLLGWLAEIPGEGAAEARRSLETLEASPAPVEPAPGR